MVQVYMAEKLDDDLQVHTNLWIWKNEEETKQQWNVKQYCIQEIGERERERGGALKATT